MPTRAYWGRGSQGGRAGAKQERWCASWVGPWSLQGVGSIVTQTHGWARSLSEPEVRAGRARQLFEEARGDGEADDDGVPLVADLRVLEPTVLLLVPRELRNDALRVHLGERRR